MRRVHLRRKDNITKRVLLHVVAFNLTWIIISRRRLSASFAAAEPLGVEARLTSSSHAIAAVAERSEVMVGRAAKT